MTTSRPYRAGLAPDEAAAEIAAQSGTQFCPAVVEAFSALFARGELSLARGNEVLEALSPPAGEGAGALGARSLADDELDPVAAVHRDLDPLLERPAGAAPRRRRRR